MRTLPGVREVETLGVADEEVRITLAASTLDPLGTADAVLAEIRRSLRAPALGASRQGERLRPVMSKGAEAREGSLARLPIPLGNAAVPLGSLAGIQAGERPAQAALRFRGEPARALYVWRMHDAAPLALDRALRRRLSHLPAAARGVRGEIGLSEATPLRALILRLALGGCSPRGSPPRRGGGSPAAAEPSLSPSRSRRAWRPPPTPSCWRGSP